MRVAVNCDVASEAAGSPEPVMWQSANLCAYDIVYPLGHLIAALYDVGIRRDKARTVKDEPVFSALVEHKSHKDRGA